MILRLWRRFFRWNKRKFIIITKVSKKPSFTIKLKKILSIRRRGFHISNVSIPTKCPKCQTVGSIKKASVDKLTCAECKNELQ